MNLSLKILWNLTLFPQPTRSPEKSSCLTNKCENIFDVVTRSVWTLMSVSMSELWTRFLVVFTQDFRSKFFFQNDLDRMWLVNFAVSPDIVCWPAIISSFSLYINLYSVRFYCYFIFLQPYMFLHRELMKIFSWFTGSWCWCWRHCILGILSSLQAVYIKTDPEAAKWLDNSCRLTLY